jgi:coproporphyrinogen III oxidase-like Fe-S oxidoreductase
MMGLRLSEGVPLSRLEALGGCSWHELFEPDRIEQLRTTGYLTLEQSRLQATASGRQRLNALLGYLLPNGGGVSPARA